MLYLATRHLDNVEAENITRAVIAQPFIPNSFAAISSRDDSTSDAEYKKFVGVK
jgi:hypothetical protein